MYNKTYFEKLNHHGLLAKIIISVLREKEIHISYGNDFDGEKYASVSVGEIDRNEMRPALHCYGEDKFGLHILFYNETLEKYDEFKKPVEKAHVSMVPEGLRSLMLEVLKARKEMTIDTKDLKR